MFINFRPGSQIFIILLCALPLLAARSASAAGATIVVIDKATQSLTLLEKGLPTAHFPVSLGLDPDSDKTRKHDLATPEGLYSIVSKKSTSRFNKLMGLSYPNLANAEKGLATGVITRAEYRHIHKAVQKPFALPCGTNLGCGIAIHGGGVFRQSDHSRGRDWTEGCVALNNADMEKLFRKCRTGDPVLILNSRRSLYGLIRPFTAITAKEPDGMPQCPDGVCTYSGEVPTNLGLIRISISENRTRSRALLVEVYADNERQTPLLVITDRNGDGYLSPLDSVQGSIAGATTPEQTYAEVRAAVLAALRKGRIVNLEGRR